ncbi:MAG: terminase family protein [Patescibacteria group bacterium]|nr:terminase family protein [Patescibacteria group bacterium]
MIESDEQSVLSSLGSLLDELKEAEKELASQDRLTDYRPYPRQAEFHAAGKDYRERLLMAGNQLGKTLAAGMEVAMHAIGQYPIWWQGRRWERPVVGWAAGVTGESTRDNPQRILLGRPGEWGTGAFPKGSLVDTSSSRGLADAVDTIRIRHVSGDISTIQLKSYEKGREKWQGETLDFVWFDEEPPPDIYYEGLTRTNATGGIVMMTFTPLLGMSEVVRRFLMEKPPGSHVTRMSIDDVDHYTAEQRAAIIASYPEYEREARTRGEPQLGEGRIFPFEESALMCQPIPIPDHWARIGGLDFGWDHPSAGVLCAWDRDSDIWYVTHAHRARQQTPILFSGAVKPWGNWPWSWPHDGLQHDKGSGDQLARLYRSQGLNMLAVHATHVDGGSGVEAGIAEMYERMQTGRFKVFQHLGDWFEEFRMYHRKDGKVVKLGDDLLSATRYALMMKRYAKNKLELRPVRKQYTPPAPSKPEGWMAA